MQIDFDLAQIEDQRDSILVRKQSELQGRETGAEARNPEGDERPKAVFSCPDFLSTYAEINTL